MQSSPESTAGARANFFEATRWSVVLAAGRDDEHSKAAAEALARLCTTYWAPLYGFVRSRGHATHDAQDLTQGFFAHLIERRIYLGTDSGKGRFRSFLLASLKNFLLDAHDRERALKRGGAHEFLPLHEEQAREAESFFENSVAADPTTAGDRLFERQWAETVVRTAFEQLAAEHAAQGKGELFAALEVFLRSGAELPPTYDELAERLGMPASTVRSTVTRMRARYRELLRAELRQTVATEAEVDDELRNLLQVLTAR